MMQLAWARVVGRCLRLEADSTYVRMRDDDEVSLREALEETLRS